MHNLHEMASHYKSDIKVNSKMVNKKKLMLTSSIILQIQFVKMHA